MVVGLPVGAWPGDVDGPRGVTVTIFGARGSSIEDDDRRGPPRGGGFSSTGTLEEGINGADGAVLM